MKLFITAEGNKLSSKPDDRFGRGNYFQIVDSETGEIIEAKENPFKSGAHGVGIKTSNYVAKNADVAICKKFGPKAAEVLKQSGVQMYITKGNTVKDVVEHFKNNKLEKFL